jgi:uncharacterized membrane protein
MVSPVVAAIIGLLFIAALATAMGPFVYFDPYEPQSTSGWKLLLLLLLLLPALLTGSAVALALRNHPLLASLRACSPEESCTRS